MLYEIIQRLINSNTIINPNEVSLFTYWDLVYKNELKYNKNIEFRTLVRNRKAFQQ